MFGRRNALPVACVAAVVALRLLGLDKGIWLDEHASIRIALNDHFLAALRSEDKAPVYYVVLRAWSWLGTTEAVLRALSVVLAGLTALLLWRWTARTSRGAAVATLAVFATLPILLRYGQEIRHYGLLLLAVTGAFESADRLARGGGRRATIVLGAWLALAVGTHPIGVFAVASVLVYTVLRLREEGALERGVITRAAMIAAPAALVVIVAYGLFLRRLPSDDWWMPRLDRPLVVLTADKTLGYPELVAAAQAVGVRVPVAWMAALELLLAITIVVAGGVRPALPLAAAAGSYLLLITGYSLVVTPIFWYRTLLPALIPLAALLGTQLDQVRPRTLRHALIALGLVPVVAWAGLWIGGAAWQPYEGWRTLAGELERRFQPGSLVAFYPGYGIGPTRYYLPLRNEDVVLLPLHLDPKKAASDIEQRRRDVAGGLAGSVFLIWRRDARTTGHDMALYQLQSELTRRVGPRRQETRAIAVMMIEYAPAPSGDRRD